MSTYIPTPRTQVKRLKKRGAYDHATVHAILDAGFMCHVGFAIEGQPYVIPTLYARKDDRLYMHGSIAARVLKSAADGIDVCVTVTHVDGLVLARSAFHHSANYRSVVVLGKATLVTDPGERMRALHLITNQVAPGRWEEVRAPNELELKQTSVISVPLVEVSAKVRTGGPIDDEEDYVLPIWAGVLPLRTEAGPLIPDERLHGDAKAPDLARFKKDGSPPTRG